MIFPDLFLRSIFDITPDLLKNFNVKALILDVDNTLRVYGSLVPFAGVLGWVDSMKKAGVRLIIASNNFKNSVEPFAERLKLDCVFFSCKPLCFGLNKAAKKLKIKKSQIAVVGDQIFTDVIGGNLSGFKTVLVEPFLRESGLSFKFKRWLEKHVISYYFKNRKRKEK